MKNTIVWRVFTKALRDYGMHGGENSVRTGRRTEAVGNIDFNATNKAECGPREMALRLRRDFESEFERTEKARLEHKVAGKKRRKREWARMQELVEILDAPSEVKGPGSSVGTDVCLRWRKCNGRGGVGVSP